MNGSQEKSGEKGEVKMDNIQALMDQIRADLQNDKSDEEILHPLLPLLGKNPELDGELAEHLATIPNVKTAKVLQKMLQISKAKRVHKIIKRALYRLKNRGIVVEEMLPKKEESILRPLQAEQPKGFVNGFDLLGNRFLLLIVPRASRGLTVLHGLTNDEKGLLNFSGGELSRKEFKTFFGEVQKASPSPFVEIEAPYVGFLFAQAHHVTLERGGTPPPDYQHLRGEVEKLKKNYERPLIYSHLRVEELRENDRMLRGAGDLFKSDLFAGWRIPEEAIRSYADAVWEAEESKIVLSQAQKESRFQEIYQRALSDLFPDEKRILYKKRLEEMAYVLLQLKREEEARMSLAAAMDLEMPLNAFQPNPFLFQLVVRSIFTLLAEVREKKTKEPSFIVKP